MNNFSYILFYTPLFPILIFVWVNKGLSLDLTAGIWSIFLFKWYKHKWLDPSPLTKIFSILEKIHNIETK